MISQKGENEMLKAVLKFVGIVVGVGFLMILTASLIPSLQNNYFGYATFVVPWVIAILSVRKKKIKQKGPQNGDFADTANSNKAITKYFPVEPISEIALPVASTPIDTQNKPQNSDSVNLERASNTTARQSTNLAIDTQKKTPTPALDYVQRRAAVIEHKRDEFSQKLNDIPRVPVILSENRTKRANMINMPEIKYSNITRSTNIQKLFPLVVVDTETTGIKPGGNDIIEISAIKYAEGFTAVSCFTTLCKPRRPIPAEATEVNNITNEMVAEAPPFALVASAFSEYIAGCNMVGHNLPFDLRFLYISGVELPQKAKYFDTLDLAKKVLTKCGGKKYNHKIGEYEELEEWDVYDYKLETLCEYYDIYRSDAHRSLSDCYATAQLFENLIEDKTS